MAVPVEKRPRHVGIILDGNRRYAKKQALQPWKGHESGKDKVEELLRWCLSYDIHELTVYAFSLQNFKRAPEEVAMLMNLFVKACKDYYNEQDADKQKIRIRVIGRKQLLPENVQSAIANIEEQTKTNGPFVFNIALAYGGREEIVDAVQVIAQQVKAGTLQPQNISEQTIDEHVYNASQPDLIIRTSGEQRTSNFLLWQSWYSEWVFLPKLWPEMTKEDFENCLLEYSKRNRRFGTS